MAIPRLKLDTEGESKELHNELYLGVSDERIVKHFKRMAHAYYCMKKPEDMSVAWFNRKGITGKENIDSQIDGKFTPHEFVAKLSNKELQFIFITMHAHKLVHKDLVAAFVRRHSPKASGDQQARHLGEFWHILGANAKIPGKNEYVPSGYYYCASFVKPNPLALSLHRKRSLRLAAKTFDEKKRLYKYRCATCGRKEGEMDERNGKIIKLQQGHMDPEKELTPENTIPQCQYCNQTYQNDFAFNENGRVTRINNPKFVLKCTKPVQKAIYDLLDRKMKKIKATETTEAAGA